MRKINESLQLKRRMKKQRTLSTSNENRSTSPKNHLIKT